MTEEPIGGAAVDAVEVVMPQMGNSIAEATITAWHKKPGEEVAEGEKLLDISTTKVEVEIHSPAAGVVSQLFYGPGDTVPVGTIIALLVHARAAAAIPSRAMADPTSVRHKDAPADRHRPTPGLRGAVKRLVVMLFRIPEGCPAAFGVKWRLGRLVGVNCHVPWPVHFTSTVHAPERVKLGRATYPGDSPHCYIQARNGIEVGDYVNLGPGVGLVSANHDPLDNNRWLDAPPIRLGAHCWIGMNAVVLPGVELGERTIVGAGAVVTKSFPQGNCIIAGNPARVVRSLERH